MNLHIKNRLQELAKNDKEHGINTKFEQDKLRVSKYSYELGGMYFDFSKTHLSDELIKLYGSLGKDVEFEQMRHKLFSGEAINNTEDRAVLHTLLRDSSNQGIKTKKSEFIDQAKISEQMFFSKYEEIIEKLKTRTEPVKSIIHVGIGGSSLGTQLVFESLSDIDCQIKVYFIGNIDAHKLATVLHKCEAKSTLLIGVSKTFSTAETLQNINTIGTWYEKNGINDWREQLYAVSSNEENAIGFGVQKTNIIGFPEWVGGRYSVWSAVSLSAVIAFGLDKFKDFLKGASDVDKYFYKTEPEQNICFIAALLDHYYANFLGVRSRAIFPYDFRLRSLVFYLQQLETESNGKDRQRNGESVDQSTSVVVWGGVGTNVQHSVFQMMHQGTSVIPAEFILVKQPDHEHIEHHEELLANGLAQPAALLAGQDLETVREMNIGRNTSELTLKSKIFSGERPSTTILLERLTPRTLGGMLAFYEHRTFCFGVLANINSYDQMGVELGKRLAKEVKPLILNNVDSEVVHSFDDSTLELLKRITTKN